MRYFQFAVQDPIAPPEPLPAEEIQARLQTALWPGASVADFREAFAKEPVADGAHGGIGHEAAHGQT